MTDTEIIEWGDKAQALIQNPDYIALYDQVTKELANAILATNVTENEYRDQLFHTYNGMRAFGTRLVNMVSQKDDVIARMDAEREQPESDFE